MAQDRKLEVPRPQYKAQRPEHVDSLPTGVTLKLQHEGVDANIDSWESANQLADESSIAGTHS